MYPILVCGQRGEEQAISKQKPEENPSLKRPLIEGQKTYWAGSFATGFERSADGGDSEHTDSDNGTWSLPLWAGRTPCFRKIMMQLF